MSIFCCSSDDTSTAIDSLSQNAIPKGKIYSLHPIAQFESPHLYAIPLDCWVFQIGLKNYVNNISDRRYINICHSQLRLELQGVQQNTSHLLIFKGTMEFSFTC